MKLTFAIIQLLYLGLWAIASPGYAASEHPDTQPALQYRYEIIEQRSHPPQLFTQGLLLHNGHFYESSGLYGRSLLVAYPKAESGERSSWLSQRLSLRRALPARYFAEGLALFDNRLYQLTWREGRVFVYHPHDLSLIGSHDYQGEGWGLTQDGNWLIRSDGSHRLYFHAPEDFRLVRTLEVMDQGRPLSQLNELEYWRNSVWANIWKDARLAQIDPESGRVIGYLDLSELVAQVGLRDPENVLNGIAYDRERDALWVTGKNWPTLFLLRLLPEPAPEE